MNCDAELFVGLCDGPDFGFVDRQFHEAGPDSDVDILVGYDELLDWKTYFAVGPYLEELSGRRVDSRRLQL